MLEHYHCPPKGEAVSADTQIERYLDTLCTRLSGTLTEEQRREYRAEMQEHLDAMIEAHRELGASETEAVERALQQFGNAQRVATAWENSVELPPKVSLRQALRAPFRCFGGMMLVWMTAFQILLHMETRLPPGVMELALTLWLVGMPVLAGSATGLLTRGRPILGTLLVMPPLHLALMLFYWLTVPQWHEGIIQSVWMQFTSWSLTGVTAAWMVYTHRKRKRRRKIA
jgi:hypothetical protein